MKEASFGLLGCCPLFMSVEFYLLYKNIVDFKWFVDEVRKPIRLWLLLFYILHSNFQYPTSRANPCCDGVTFQSAYLITSVLCYCYESEFQYWWWILQHLLDIQIFNLRIMSKSLMRLFIYIYINKYTFIYVWCVYLSEYWFKNTLNLFKVPTFNCYLNI